MFIISAFFILFTATTSPVSMWRHILTSPNAPRPMIDSGSKSLVEIFFLIFLFNSASLCKISYFINSCSAPDKFNFCILCWRMSQAYFLFDSSFLSFLYFDSIYCFAYSALSFIPFVIWLPGALAAAVPPGWAWAFYPVAYCCYCGFYYIWACVPGFEDYWFWVFDSIF